MPRLTNLDFTEARDNERQWHQLSYASLLLTPDKQYENNVIQADTNIKHVTQTKHIKRNLNITSTQT